MSEDSKENDSPVFAVYYPDNILASPRNLYNSLREATRFANSPEGRNNGARFKRFDSSKEATEFLEGRGSTAEAGGSGDGAVKKELLPADPVVPFPAVSRVQMNELKRRIEKDDMAGVGELANDNPRFLINVSSDTAAIVVEGFRYNGLHVAARSGAVNSARLILHFVSDINYLRRVYGTADEDLLSRRANILDSYLNTPDKGNGDTCLHLAAKFGHVHIVQLLLASRSCDRNTRNKSGERAVDTVCSRSNGDSSAKKGELEALFHAHYVALFRSSDNCSRPRLRVTAERPLLQVDGVALPGPDNPSTASPLAPSFSLAAFAGPFQEEEAATEFMKDWRSRDLNIQRSDEEKGMERVGRLLAKEAKVTWAESWPFSKGPVDISSVQGLKALEGHLWQKRLKAEEDEGEEEFVDAFEEFSCDEGQELNGLMQALSLGDCGRAGNGDVPPADDCVQSSEEEVEAETESSFFTPPCSPPPFFACCEDPTRMDAQLFQVLDSVAEDDLSGFPLVQHYLALMRRLPQSEMAAWPPLDSPRRRTPRSLLRQADRESNSISAPSSPRPESPLVSSTPRRQVRALHLE